MVKLFIGTFFLLFSFIFTNHAFAVSCVAFNNAGTARSAEDFTKTKFTASQIELFKKVIASHAGEISAFGVLSKRKKALDLIIKNDDLAWFIANSLSMTRHDCLLHPERKMNNLAIENFNFLIDAAAEKL